LPPALPTAAPFANIIPACNITDDCPESLNQCERYFCNASSTCELEPGLDCNDNNQCTIDSCSAANGCDHLPLNCSQNENCDPFDGKCKPSESLRPCIAVIDESDMPNATVNSKWSSFRASFPDRPFCLLRPIKSYFLNLPTKPDFLSDPRTIYSNVTRDEGDPLLTSDWFTICGISVLNSTGVDFVGLFIDESGSMNISTVRASYEKFLGDLTAANLSHCTVTNRFEDWITPFSTTLGEIGGGGECVVNRL
jgi:hypothetical protein